MLKVDLVVEWIRVSVAAIKNLRIVLSFFDNVFAMLWATHSNLVSQGSPQYVPALSVWSVYQGFVCFLKL